MATLEKIRSKSVLLIIVIGVALLAFIVGDALTNGRNLFGDPTTVAKVDGIKIDVTEYQRALEEASQRNQESQRPTDSQLLIQQVLDQMIMERLIQQSIENLGITVSGEQLRVAMLENFQNQDVMMLMQQMRNLGMMPTSAQEAYDMIFNPQKYGLPQSQVEALQSAWIAIEETTKEQLKQQTFVTLLQGSIKANELDKKALHHDVNISSTVKMAFKPFGVIEPEKYPVTEEEIKAEYDRNKHNYRVEEPTKAVNFISVAVVPSEADIKECRELASKTQQTVVAEGIVGLDKSLKAQGVASMHYVARQKDVKANAKNFVANAAIDSVAIINQGVNGFTILRMDKKLQEVDSIQINMVTVMGSTLPKKVLAELNSGISLDSIQKTYKDSVQVQKENWLQLISSQGRMQMDKTQLDSLLNAGSEYFELMSQPQGALLTQVIKKNAPVTVYEYDEITYVLSPSDATMAAEREKLEKFLAENQTVSAFVENASKAGFNSTPAMLTASTPAMGRQPMMLPDSRQVVKWVMLEAEDGEVSEIFESPEGTRPYLYAVAVEGSFDDYIPHTYATVRTELEEKVRRSKVAEEMLNQFKTKGTTIEEVAQAMGVTPTESVVEFGNPRKVGDMGLVGQIVMTAAGKPVVVVKGENGIYAFQVTAVNDNQLQYEDEKYVQNYMRKHNPNFVNMLRGNKEVVNNLLKFYGGN